jgi:hypothetical protein
MSDEGIESRSPRETPRGRHWSWYDIAPEVLLGIASVALLMLVVASALGWIF